VVSVLSVSTRLVGRDMGATRESPECEMALAAGIRLVSFLKPEAKQS